MSFDQIPEELKTLRQWVVWRYAERSDGKLTKLPYNPHTLRLASVTDSGTWADFATAVARSASVPGVSGIGLVLTDDDDYCFIDLDDPFARNQDGSNKWRDPEEWFNRQKTIFDVMPTYAERSPSGRGVHLIARGSVAGGRRRGPIELYSSERYMTMTGDVFRPEPIRNCQPQIDWLYQQLGGKQTAIPEAMLYTPDPAPDEEILQRAFGAVNGEKTEKLFNGQWEQFYGSQSEADFALIDILQFHTKSRQQVKRLFLRSMLAKREKAHRPGYVEYMIQKSFDREPVGVDIEAMMAALDETRRREAEAQARAAEAAGVATIEAPPAKAPMSFRVEPAYEPHEASPYITPVPGLLGSIAYFIYRASPRPVPEIAMAGAIGLMAGICGRAFNVNSTGLNSYVLLLAKTGRGKEAIASGIARLMQPVKQIDGGGGGVPGADEFIGPQEIASGQALIKYMAKTSRSFVSVISEFDQFLSHLTQRNIPASTAKLKQVLLYAYSRSGYGQRLDKSIYSEAEKNVPVIPSPAISLIGEGTPDRFYSLLSDDLIADGFLTRFSIIEYIGPRVELSEHFASVQPEPELVQAVARLCAHALSLNQKEQVQDVALAPEARRRFDAFDRECDQRINTNNADTITQLWNRAHLKALKLAALVAVGVNWYAPVITDDIAEWAISATRHDTGRLTVKFEVGAVGTLSTDAIQMQDAKRKLRKLFDGRTVNAATYRLTPEALAAGVFNSYYLQSACTNLQSFKNDRRGSSGAYNAMLETWRRMGVIDELGRADKERLHINGAAFVVKEWGWLNSGDD